MLLSNPDYVSDDGYFGFSSALYRFMVPKKSEPSAHNVMTGLYVPNGSDLAAGHTAGFGTTMQIIDKTYCGSGTRHQEATARANKYTSFQESLGLSADTQYLNCESMWGTFAWGGVANKL